jgi:hypothetical protein
MDEQDEARLLEELDEHLAKVRFDHDNGRHSTLCPSVADCPYSWAGSFVPLHRTRGVPV